MIRRASTYHRNVASTEDEAQAELSELRPTEERVRQLEAELDSLRRAHEAQARHLISERLAFADQFESEIKPLRDEVAWREDVMEELAKQLELLQQSRSLRYTEPLRRVAAALRRR